MSSEKEEHNTFKYFPTSRFPKNLKQLSRLYVKLARKQFTLQLIENNDYLSII